MARSNPLPIARNRLKTPYDYARAKIMLDEIDGKITQQEADAQRKALRDRHGK